MLANKWWRGYFYAVSVITMLFFGYAALESYRQEMWTSLGTTLGWCFIGAWMFFGMSFTPSKAPEITISNKPSIAAASEAASRIYPTGQYVYLIQDVTVTGYFKIGKTNNPSRRMYDFGVLLPMQVKVIHVIPCQNMSRLEAELHAKFASKRVNGEWFALDAADVETVKGIGGE